MPQKVGKMKAECGECGAIVNGEEFGSYVDTEDGSGIYGKYTFLKCPNCRNPIVMLQTDDGNGATQWGQPQRIYPADIVTGSPAVPYDIAVAYGEARKCFKATSYTAAAIMCRKTLEGITEAHNIESRNLAQGLKKMRDEGIIENRLYEWADALRVSGNEAAHGVGSTTSAQDARDIMDLTNAILEYVFTFRDTFERWKERRSKSGSRLENSPAPDETDLSGK